MTIECRMTKQHIASGRCYAGCDEAPEGYALRDQDGGPARGDEAPTTIAVPACRRHAWDPDMHPAIERIAPKPLRLELVPCTLKRAMEFVSATHRHHDAPQGGLWAVGVKKGHKLVGVAIVGRPVARHLQDGKTAEVTRVATREERNACSMLYGACRRAAAALGFRKLITYTRAVEPGVSLRASGWREVAEVRGESWDREDRPREEHTVEDRKRWELILGQQPLPIAAATDAA